MRGLPRLRRALTDVDFVATDANAVSPSVTGAFMMSHFHRPHPGYSKFMLQLVEPKSRLRVDVFPGQAELIQQATTHDLGGARFRVLDLDAVLDHKLTVLEGASEQRPIDRKHFDDAQLLGRALSRRVQELPETVLCREQYSTDTTARCSRCECSLSSALPLATKQEIFDVLGYV
ncbi:MAG: hypothetical protein ACKVX7_08295 [Planctomycetota bacterium]